MMSQRLDFRTKRRVIAASLVVTLFVSFVAFGRTIKDDPIVLRPKAVVQTDPVLNEGDAADDPAIWVHPTDPALSLVLGTDKKGGLDVFDLNGKRLQIVSKGSRPNNVDVIYGFPIDGKPVDLAVAGTRIPGKFGMAIWKIDPTNRQLSELDTLPIFKVFDGGEPYGSCVYQSPRDKSFYCFVSNKDGVVEQYRLESHSRTIKATLVRAIKVGSQVEGCVADNDLGFLYVGEEDVAIWKYGAEPDSGSNRTLVAKVGENGLVADVEGLTIYYGPGSSGYLIASSQGNDTYKIFERDGTNAFVASIDPDKGEISDVGETDGIDVVSVPLSPRFPKGLFVVQDGKPSSGRQNFKYFDWQSIAGDRLKVDSRPSVRSR